MKNKNLNTITSAAILICSYCFGQTSDFVVTTDHDTIYVGKLSVADSEVKTKTGGVKKKYKFDDVISYYKFEENQHYARIQLEQPAAKAPDRYDYQRNDNFISFDSDNGPKYKFIKRLTHGKVKLFAEVFYNPGFGIPGQANYTPAQKDEKYYISIFDAKPELIKKPTFDLFDFSDGLTLRNEVYDMLKIYLHGNNEISAKLDRLFVTKPVAKEQQILDLVNEYNVWAKSNK